MATARAMNRSYFRREANLAGATVLRGVMGFGKHSILHTAKILRLSEDMQWLSRLLIAAEKIETFLRVLDELIKDGLVTIEKLGTSTIVRDQS
jgi:PII-like signaling protein